MEEVGMAMNGAGGRQAARLRPECPRCHSGDTKFCYYNNYSLLQPRYHCRSCRRYWTQGGSLHNVPVGGGCRNRNKQRSSGSGKIVPTLLPSAAASSSSGPTAMASSMVNLIPNMLPAFVPPPGWGSDLVPPAAATPCFLDILRSGGVLLPIDGAMLHRQGNTDYYAGTGIGMAMPLPAVSSFGTAMMQQQHPELAIGGMGGATMLQGGGAGAGDEGVGALPMPVPMVGLEWQPQLIGGINGGVESSGVAQQHLGADENNMKDNNNNINDGEGSSRDDYYWINDNNNGGLTNNSSSLM